MNGHGNYIKAFGFKTIATLLPDFALYFLSRERLAKREHHLSLQPDWVHSQFQEQYFYHHQHLTKSTQNKVSLAGMTKIGGTIRFKLLQQ